MSCLKTPALSRMPRHSRDSVCLSCSWAVTLLAASHSWLTALAASLLLGTAGTGTAHWHWDCSLNVYMAMLQIFVGEGGGLAD